MNRILQNNWLLVPLEAVLLACTHIAIFVCLSSGDLLFELIYIAVFFLVHGYLYRFYKYKSIAVIFPFFPETLMCIILWSSGIAMQDEMSWYLLFIYTAALSAVTFIVHSIVWVKQRYCDSYTRKL